MRTILFLSALFVAACGGGGNGGGSTAPNPVPPNPSSTPISDIQGAGATSPLDGQAVTVSGIVTGDFQDNDAETRNNLGGFYVQQPVPDGDPATSEGIFIFDGSNPAIDVDIGDQVDVEGTVAEFFGETQVTATSVTITGSGTIQPTDIALPVAGVTTNSSGDVIANLEQYEGMLVRFGQTLTVGQLFELESYGSVGLTEGGRAYQFTNQNAPDVANYAAYRESLAARTVLLDDGRRQRDVTPVRLLDAGAQAGYSIRTGDEITGLTGTVRYSRGSGNQGIETYRIMPTAEPQFVAANPRPGPPHLTGSLRVASFNALNLFSTIDTGANICGPDSNDGCRGADTASELDRQVGKLATAIQDSGADIVGLMELENDGGAALQLLTDTLNAAGTSYDFVNTGAVGDDAITTGFVYDSSTVAPTGNFAVLDDSVDARFNDNRNRPALAQAFTQLSNGATFSIVVNHLKSKGSSCAGNGDPNQSDGQGNCNGTRTGAAEALADWVATDPTGSGDSDYLVIGDLNAYLLEDPLTALKNGGFTSLLESEIGVTAWSFVFDGQSGALDHALANGSLLPQVSGVLEWHINADEPPLLDYNLEGGRDPSLFDAATPYRASDHDPVIIGLDLTP